MPSGLKRDLGLPETFAIAVGAMIGSGIFVLPGVAWFFADSAAVLAFVIAAVLVLPAALAVAEMATAIPEDGGPYLYVERSMGPLLGTIAGVGTWLMLTLKSALALVGGVPYLVYVDPTLAEFVIVLAVSLALLFTVVNLVSAEGSGKLQFAIVGILLVILAAYAVAGVPEIDPERTAGAFDPTTGGILAATAIVFISYAGLTKIGAVAEEVENPGRNLPLAILGALAFVTLTYALVVYITIGVLDVPAAIEGTSPAVLSEDGEGAIIALAAEEVIGGVGAIAIVVAALMALASTANAGLLAASRFPLAMARDGVFPSKLEEISERFATPAYAVALTGVILTAMTFLPIQAVAAFGSAFQILVFVLLNVALIGFREGAIESYDPAFETPLYPWMPLFGIFGGVLVLSYMETIAIVGALGIGALAGLWYLFYVVFYRDGLDREGAARTRVRQDVGERAVERTRELFTAKTAGTYDVLVAVTEGTTRAARRDMLRIASDLGRLRTTVISVVEFIDVPDHVSPGGQTGVRSADTPEFLPTDPDEAPDWFPGGSQPRTSGGVAADSAATDDPRASVDYREIGSRDHRQAIVDFATFEDVDLLFLERQAREGFSHLFGSRETAWILQHAPCGVALVEDRGFDEIDEIAVVATHGPYDPLKLLIADAVAEETDAEINLLRAIPENAPAERRETAERYHSELLSILTVPGRSTVLETDDQVDGLARFVGDADLLVTGVSRGGVLDRLQGSRADQLVETVDCTAVMVQPRSVRRRSLLERFVLDRLF
ncbi:APC family permease [Halorubrum luteum]